MWIFRWVRHQKLRLFLEPYHAPYTFKHRYWTGLLLLSRVILYVVTAVNIDNDPRVNLLATGLITSGLFALKDNAGITCVNRQWPVEVLDTVCYFNIISLTFVSLFFVDTAEQNFVAAYISVSITVGLLVVVLLFHLFNEVSCLKKVCHTLKLKLSSSNNSCQTHVPTQTYLPAILDFNREEEDHEESTRSEHETCSDSDSGDVTSTLLEHVATY